MENDRMIEKEGEERGNEGHREDKREREDKSGKRKEE